MSTPAPDRPQWRRRLGAVGSTSRNVARDTAGNAADAVREHQRQRAARTSQQPWFRPTSWYGALAVMGVAAALLWVLQIVNASLDYTLTRHLALMPRNARGLWGVLAAPFLHTSYFHLLSNTVPFILIGWVVLLAGVRGMVLTTVVVTVLGGLLAWLVSPSGTILGAGLLIIGWMGYLMARAYFSKAIKWIIVAVLVLFFFGTLLGALVPHFDRGLSWEAYASYFAAGVVAAALLHYRRRAPAPPRPTIREAFGE